MDDSETKWLWTENRIGIGNPEGGEMKYNIGDIAHSFN